MGTVTIKKKYRDEYGNLHAHAGVYNSENYPMFTCMSNMITEMPMETYVSNGTRTRVVSSKAFNCVRKMVNDKKGLIDYKFPSRILSHDDITTVCAWSYINGYVAHEMFWKILIKNKLKYEGRPLHPRDILFLGLLNNSTICRLLSPLLSIMMVHSQARVYKRRTYGNGNKVKLIHTDGKLLNWVRLKTGLMPLTRWLCNKIIKMRKKHFNGNWKGVFDVYFEDGHPLRGYEVQDYEL